MAVDDHRLDSVRNCLTSKGLLKKSSFAGCSKRTLPSPKRLPSARLLEAGLRAGRQMLVELCEIPFAGAPEILRVASRRIRSDYLPRLRVGEPARGVLQGKRRRWSFFSNLLKLHVRVNGIDGPRDLLEWEEPVIGAGNPWSRNKHNVSGNGLEPPPEVFTGFDQ